MTTRKTSRTLLTSACAVVLAFAGTILVAESAAAAPFSVGTEGDLNNAIAVANGNGQPDVITLTADIVLTGDLTVITEDLQIIGDGFTIDGDGNTAFHVIGSAPNIDTTFTNVAVNDALWGLDTTDSNVTITSSTFDNAPVGILGDGITVSVDQSAFDNASTEDGFYVDMDLSSHATITHSSADGNLNDSDGFEIDLSNGSTLDVSDSTASGNTDEGFDINAQFDSTVTLTTISDTGSGDNGIKVLATAASTITLSDSNATGSGDDGFDAATVGPDSTITFTNCTSNNNGPASYASGFDFDLAGGTIDGSNLTAMGNVEAGLDVYSEGSGSVTVSDSTFSGTTDGYGVNLDPKEESTVTLERVSVTGNDSGGVLVDDDGFDGDNNAVTIADSTFADNDGSGLDIFAASSTDVVVDGTTISGNSQDGAGGIYIELYNDSSLEVLNSTISGNTQEFSGAVFVSDFSDATASVDISHSTIVNNVTDDELQPGGLAISTVTYSIDHSIIAGNTSDGAPADLRFDSAALPTGNINYSLVQNSTDDALTAVDAGTGNLKAIPALLGPLADNGGPTLTHLPQDSSPVIGAGNPAIVGAPSTDQRGQTRVVGIIEMGAVEMQAALAATGVDSALPIVGGSLLLGAGVLLLIARRKRAAIHQSSSHRL